MRRKTGAVGQFAVNVGHKRAHRVEIRIINTAEVKSSTACLYGWPYHRPFPYREEEEEEEEDDDEGKGEQKATALYMALLSS